MTVIHRALRLCLLWNVQLFSWLAATGQPSNVTSKLAALLPHPQEVSVQNGGFKITVDVRMAFEIKNPSGSERFAAEDLQRFLSESYQLNVPVATTAAERVILFRRLPVDKTLGDEGYRLAVTDEKIEITAATAAGWFYAVQTLKQLVTSDANNVFVSSVKIRDWPDTRFRAVHYDTKHHQDNRKYVEHFIRELAAYKINMLVWEWEDKFEYPSHPEIGAPGAFTMKEMKELTRFAQQYHVQIVPLVQGLGHAGFILKWPQFAHLREIAASNFEFCPLKEGSYQLLLDLWKDAVEATPGSEFLHIGSDETYELGACENCKKVVEQNGRSGLFHHFLGKSVRMLKPTNRQVMAWEAPMGWAKSRLGVYHGGTDDKQQTTIVPEKGLVLTESYDYETPDLKYARQARKLGYSLFAYDPNPGIEQLFLPYFFTKDEKTGIQPGALQNSVDFLKRNLGKSVFDGVIRTSWDDSGLPMQSWMLSFATTANYSWNVSDLSKDELVSAFFANRYGPKAENLHTLYRILNEAAYFYMESFERRVWAWGEIGKTHLPDLPRGDALEYDPYWRTEYADRLRAASLFRLKLDTAIAICKKNLAAGISNQYDVEVFLTLCNLARHTALTYLDLASLEEKIKSAHEQRFVDLETAYKHLQSAEKVVKHCLERRQSIFSQLVDVWERTRLPKGMSTPAKKYFFEQERTRHFANRVPDMSYLIYDEQKLGLEEYLKKLQAYTSYFQERYIKKH